MVFPGQGSQFVGMAKDVYESGIPAAQQVFAAADAAFRQHGTVTKGGPDLTHRMFNGSAAELTRTSITQPAILCHSIALLRAWEASSHSRPHYVLGHSLGEITALVATGALSLFDGIRLACARGQVMEECETNSSDRNNDLRHCMKALLIAPGKGSLEQILAHPCLTTRLPMYSKTAKLGVNLAQVANINSSTQIVLSGTRSGVEGAVLQLHSSKLIRRAVDLPVSGAFHSDLMFPAADRMRTILASISLNRPVVPIVCNVTAQPTQDPEVLRANLVHQITQPVQWLKSMGYARKQGVTEWLTFGPQNFLGNVIKREFPKDSVVPLSTLDEVNSEAR